MNDLAEVAQRLRIVREAHRRFLALHAVEVSVIEPVLDRVAEDLNVVIEPSPADEDDDDGDNPGDASPGW
jgi:hypothetical protein